MSNKLRGHPIELRGGEWVFSDTGEPTVATYKSRPCGHCRLRYTAEGHDPCLGTLPGVVNACCGHGDEKKSYIMFENGVIVRGFAVVEDAR